MHPSADSVDLREKTNVDVIPLLLTFRNGHVCQSDGVEEPILLHTLIGKSIANHRSPAPVHDETQLRDRLRALTAE